MSDVLTLLWKEYRTNAHLIVIGLSVLFLPVILAFSLAYGNAEVEVTFIDTVSVGLIFGGLAGLILSQLMMLCLGGYLIGGERSSRTFEFLFSQPVSKTRIILTKLFFALLWVVVIWLLAGAMLLVGTQMNPPGEGVNLDGVTVEFFMEIAAFGAMLFGSAWLASNKIDSSILAMAIGAIATTAVIMVLQLIASRFDALVEIRDYDWTRIIALGALSAVAIALGSRIFINRKSP